MPARPLGVGVHDHCALCASERQAGERQVRLGTGVGTRCAPFSRARKGVLRSFCLRVCVVLPGVQVRVGPTYVDLCATAWAWEPIERVRACMGALDRAAGGALAYMLGLRVAVGAPVNRCTPACVWVCDLPVAVRACLLAR